jgi:predicted O-methyltransferase YrrM
MEQSASHPHDLHLAGRQSDGRNACAERGAAMLTKSTSAFAPWQRAVWPAARLFVPRRTRWFFEGHPKLDGQLWRAERRLLYDTVRDVEPGNCFEIGTWKGGGSTLFIAQALHDNGSGVLHTIETDARIAAQANQAYEKHLPRLLRHVQFHAGDYRSEYAAIIASAGSVDFLFLDGAEDSSQTLAQYEFFLPHLRAGSVVAVHDWFTEKARLVKTVLEDPREWRTIEVLSPPESVGCAVKIRI